MAAAILALKWDVGLKPRAVLTPLSALELNYVDGRHCHDGGVPVNAWEIDPAGYSSATARPYDDIKLRVRKVIIHSSWPQVGTTNASYLLNSFQNMTEVSGFENLGGITSANQMFTSCPALETIYATSFSNSNLSGVRSMRFMFASAAVATLDFCGFDPSALTDLYYAFSGCKKLATIYADSTWALPSSGISGSQCFYNCSTSLVGGAGTVWASSNTGYQYMRINEAGQAGYLTAA